MMLRAGVFGIALAISASNVTAQVAFPEPDLDAVRDRVRAGLQAIAAEKKSRTEAQQKIDSKLLVPIRAARGEVAVRGLPREWVDEAGYIKSGRVDLASVVSVEIKGSITPSLLSAIEANGGVVLAKSVRYGILSAELPRKSLEVVAASSDVRSISESSKAIPQKQSTSAGDVAHQGPTARQTYGITGDGVKVGVISDSVDYLAATQATGDLPSVTVVSNNTAGELGKKGRSGEGTAMLEIVHDLAPDADLLFATGYPDQAAIVNAIEALVEQGADIIVDDLFFKFQSPFQDDVIARAAEDAIAAGVHYFTSAANYGNRTDATASVYEADYNSSGAPLGGYSDIHLFSSTDVSNYVYASGDVCLFWSDPLGGSSNDYDLLVFNSTLTTLITGSANAQTGTQDARECISVLAGQRLVVARYSGEARFIHLSLPSNFGRSLDFTTGGFIRGQGGAKNVFTVAAVSANNRTTAFNGSESTNTFSSDGYRRIFFERDGTAITPGNFSSTGGEVRVKPEITAADGVATQVPGFNPFPGTSAAAPHAAAIGALLLEANPNLTRAQMLAAFSNGALDIEAPGTDRDSGVGIITATGALSYVLPNYSVTASASPSSSGSVACSPTSVISGQTSSCTVTPNSGYQIAGVTGTCGGSLSGNTYTTNAITAACTVQASFSQITHSVTPSAGAGGSISPATVQTVAEGSTTSFTVAADSSGWVASVGGTCGGSLSGNTYTTNTITAACTVQASFSQTAYTVTPSAGANGSISPASAQTVASGSTTTFTLTPAAGYEVASVGGTCGGSLSGNTYVTNAINGSCTVQASFTQASYTVTPSAGAGGAISPATAQTITSGSTTSFTLTPTSGYEIASVGGTCGGALSGNTYTTNAITASCTVDASFSQITYTVTPSAGAGGSINPGTAQEIAEGSTTTFAVRPDNGYEITSVGGTCGGTLSGNTYTTNAITAACSVDATFNQITHAVTPSAGAGGSISPSTAQTIAEGSTTTFTVTPDSGYQISAVGGTCGGSLSGNTYTTDEITAACTVEASFTQSTYSVTPSAGAGGSISPATAQTVAEGATASFVLTPDKGYEIASVAGTCGGTLSGTTYTTNAITAACTVVASYARSNEVVNLSGGATLTLDFGDSSSCQLTAGSAKVSNTPTLPSNVSSAIATQVEFSLDSCATAESVAVTVDFGATLPQGSKAYKVIGDNWIEIANATITGSSIAYTVTDNGPYDSNPADGVVDDPVTAAVPVSNNPVAVPIWRVQSLWLLAAAILGFGVFVLGRRSKVGAVGS